MLQQRVKPIKDLKDIDILYVEDEDEIRDTLANILRRHIRNLYLASNGEQGLELFKEKKPDIVVTDIQMPIKNGMAMAREIKEIDPNIKVIITTAFGETEYLIEAIEIEVSGYLIKPINKNKLFSSLNDNAKNILFDKHEKKLQKYSQQIIDFQKNMVVITDSELKLIKANSSFLSFFKSSTLDEFLRDNQDINEFIVAGGDSYINSLSCEVLAEIIENDKENEVVKFKNQDSKEKSFIINATEINNEKDDKEYIISFTDITAIDLENKTLEKKATVDKLTGIYNREKFSEQLKYSVELFKLQQRELAVIFFDIDFFKSINDNFGHDAGDYILKELSNLISSKLRDSDIFARWGGEEFIILLPKTTLEPATQLAERLREAIESYDFKYRKITSSFGVSIFLENDDEDSFIKRVDNNLYEAKNSGRNMVISK